MVQETAREVGRGLLREGKTTLTWGVLGAIVGAVVVGGAAAFKFGPRLGLIGGAVGLVVGGIGAAALYVSATTISE